MERLDEDLAFYFRERVALRSRNVTQAKYDYRSMYTDELAGIVGTVFRDDIEHFGFRFDGSATRNVYALS